jgi:hypothetical protein
MARRRVALGNEVDQLRSAALAWLAAATTTARTTARAYLSISEHETKVGKHIRTLETWWEDGKAPSCLGE